MKNTNINISGIVLKGGSVDKSLYKKCIDSLKWTDELVVISSDALIKSKPKLTSYADWRNEGKRLAKGKWLLYLDTDEELTKDLVKEIEQIIKEDNQEFGAYAIPRKNILLGKYLKWGGWSPDYVIRLIRKKNLVKWEGELHEQPVFEGKLGYLKESIKHVSHRSLSDMIDKTNKWSEIEAQLLFESKHPKMNILRFFSAGFREFWYRAILKLGFLDGPIGIIEIIYQVYSRLITYSKLWEKQQSLIRT